MCSISSLPSKLGWEWESLLDASTEPQLLLLDCNDKLQTQISEVHLLTHLGLGKSWYKIMKNKKYRSPKAEPNQSLLNTAMYKTRTNWEGSLRKPYLPSHELRYTDAVGTFLWLGVVIIERNREWVEQHGTNVSHCRKLRTQILHGLVVNTWLCPALDLHKQTNKLTFTNKNKKRRQSIFGPFDQAPQANSHREQNRVSSWG